MFTCLDSSDLRAWRLVELLEEFKTLSSVAYSLPGIKAAQHSTSNPSEIVAPAEMRDATAMPSYISAAPCFAYLYRAIGMACSVSHNRIDKIWLRKGEFDRG